MTVACTQLRQEVKDGPRAQKWALAHAGVNRFNAGILEKISMNEQIPL